MQIISGEELLLHDAVTNLNEGLPDSIYQHLLSKEWQVQPATNNVLPIDASAETIALIGLRASSCIVEEAPRILWKPSRFHAEKEIDTGLGWSAVYSVIVGITTIHLNKRPYINDEGKHENGIVFMNASLHNSTFNVQF